MHKELLLKQIPEVIPFQELWESLVEVDFCPREQSAGESTKAGTLREAGGCENTPGRQLRQESFKKKSLLLYIRACQFLILGSN